MELLGARIAELHPRCHVLVLGNPFTKDAHFLNTTGRYDRSGLRGLRKGLGRKAAVKVVYPEIRPEYLANPQSIFVPPDSRTPVSFVIQASSVNALAETHREFGVIVSVIGLPAGMVGLNVWTNEAPAFALLLPDLRLLGPPSEVVSAFQRGKILAAVVEDMQSGDPLVVTRENIEEVLHRQPKALGF